MKYQILIVNDNTAGESTDLYYNSANNLHGYNNYINRNDNFPSQKSKIQVTLDDDSEINSINNFSHVLHDFIVNNKTKNTRKSQFTSS